VLSASALLLDVRHHGVGLEPDAAGPYHDESDAMLELVDLGPRDAQDPRHVLDG
jgi:hypothetical protein